MPCPLFNFRIINFQMTAATLTSDVYMDATLGFDPYMQ